MSDEKKSFKAPFSQFFEEIFNSMLKKYCKNSAKLLLDWNIIRTHEVDIQNIELRHDVFLMHYIPLIINESRIEKIKLIIPNLLKASTWKIEIENIEMHLRLLVEHRELYPVNLETLVSNSKMEDYKKMKLKEWENNMSKCFEKYTPPGYTTKLIYKLMKNITLSIKKISLYLESESILGKPTIAKFHLENISINNTNENGIETFMPDSPHLYKNFIIKNLSISLNMKNDTHTNANANSTNYLVPENTPSQVDYTSRAKNIKNKPKTGNESQLFIDKQYKKLKSLTSYLLLPIDINIHIRILENSNDLNLKTQAKNTFTINLDKPIFIVLNNNNMNYLISLSDQFKTMLITQKYLHLRPFGLPIQNSLAWFRYAAHAVIEERKAMKNLFKLSSTKLIQTRKYIDCYKRMQKIINVPWLSRITLAEVDHLKKLESEFPLKSLLEYREMAFAEIRIEARNFFRRKQSMPETGSEQTVTFRKNEGGNNNVKNEKNQIDTQESISHLDKSINLEQYLKDEDSDPDQIQNEINVHIGLCYILLGDSNKRKTNLTLDLSKYELKEFIRENYVYQANLNKMANNLDQHYYIGRNQNITAGRGVTSSNSGGASSNLPDPMLHNRNGPKIGLHRLESFEHKESNIDESFKSALEDCRGYDNSEEIQDALSNSKTDSIILGDYYTMRNNNRLEFNNTGDNPRQIASGRAGTGANGHDDGGIFINLEEVISPKSEYDIKKSQELKLSNTRCTDHLILLVEIYEISCSLQQLKNGRLRTNDNQQISLASLMITSPLNVKQAIYTRDQFYEKKSRIGVLQCDNLTEYILKQDFGDQTNENLFLEYLEDNKLKKYADFIRLYQSDKARNSKFTIKDINSYQRFFDPTNMISFIDFPTDLVNNFQRYTMQADYRRYIQEYNAIIMQAYSTLLYHFDKYFIPKFLFCHGMVAIPHIITSKCTLLQQQQQQQNMLKSNIMMKKQYESQSQNNDSFESFDEKNMFIELLKLPLYKLCYDLRDCSGIIIAHSVKALKIALDLPGKPKQFAFLKDKQDSEATERSTPRTQVGAFVKVEINPLSVYFSTETLTPLNDFMKIISNKKSKSDDFHKDDKQITINDYKILTMTLNFSKEDMINENFTNELQIDFSMKRLELIIQDFSPIFKTDMQLRLIIDGIFFAKKKPIEFETLFTKQIRESIKKKNDIYHRFYITLNRISLNEEKRNEDVKSIYNGKLRGAKQTRLIDNMFDTSWKFTNIFETSLSCIIKKSIYNQNIFSTDLQVTLIIPTLQINLSNDLILFSEIISILNIQKSTKSKDNYQDHKAAYSHPNNNDHKRHHHHKEGSDYNENNVYHHHLTIVNSEKNNALANKFDCLIKFQGPFINMSDNQKKEILAKLLQWEKDHELNLSVCRHCFIRYIKSHVLLNIFLGDVIKYTRKQNDYGIIDSYMKEKFFDETRLYKAQGLKISIQQNLLNENNDGNISKVMLRIPFICITKDLGFFKDNTMVHCSSSQEEKTIENNGQHVYHQYYPRDDQNNKKNNNKEIISNVLFMPNYKISSSSPLDLLNNLGDNFWEYFQSQENLLFNEVGMMANNYNSGSVNKSKLMDKSKDKALSDSYSNNNSNYNGDDNSNKRIYLLFLRKRNLKLDLIKQFKIYNKSETINKTLLSLKDISIKFDSANHFCSIINTLLYFQHKNMWFSNYLKMPMRIDYDEEPETSHNFKLKSSSSSFLFNVENNHFKKEMQLLTQEAFFIEIMNIELEVVLTNMNALIEPVHPLKFTLENLIFKNSPVENRFTSKNNSHSHSSILKVKASNMNKDRLYLLHLSSLKLELAGIAEGMIKDIVVDFHETKSGFLFWIKHLIYKSKVGEGTNVLECPCDNMNEKAFEVEITPEYTSNLRAMNKFQIVCKLKPLKMKSSKTDLSQAIGLFESFQEILLEEKDFTREYFKSQITEETYQTFRIQRPYKPRVKIANTPMKHLYSSNNINVPFLFDATFSLISISFHKGDPNSPKEEEIEFSLLKISNIRIRLQEKWTVDIGDIKFIPIPSEYESMINKIPDRESLILQIVQDENDETVLNIKNAQFIFLNRPIKELMLFKLEIMDEIARYKKTFTSKLKESQPFIDVNQSSLWLVQITLLYQILKPASISSLPKTLLKIKMEDCLLIIPKSTQHKDCISVTVQRLEGTLSQEIKEDFSTLDLTNRVERLHLYDKGLIYDEKQEYVKTSMKLINLKLNASNALAYFCIDTMQSYLGSAQSVIIMANVPDGKKNLDNWNLDAKIDIHFHKKYEVALNLGLTDNIEAIIKTNLDEESRCFKSKKNLYDNIQISLFGKDTGINLTKHTISQEKAEPFLINQDKSPGVGIGDSHKKKKLAFEGINLDLPEEKPEKSNSKMILKTINKVLTIFKPEASKKT